ncbi:hypothetical protein EK904_005503 [Melospiza melodia maxima]|nr:hypothetical protein EK904_005503 [Melospiza melodia maxima]
MTYQNKNELFTLKPQDPIKGEGKVSTESRGLQQLPTAGNSEKNPRLQRFKYRQSAKRPARESQFCQALTTPQRILWLLSPMVFETPSAEVCSVPPTLLPRLRTCSQSCGV